MCISWFKNLIYFTFLFSYPSSAYVTESKSSTFDNKVEGRDIPGRKEPNNASSRFPFSQANRSWMVTNLVPSRKVASTYIQFSLKKLCDMWQILSFWGWRRQVSSSIIYNKKWATSFWSFKSHNKEVKRGYKKYFFENILISIIVSKRKIYF